MRIEIGKRLRELRLARGISLADVGARTVVLQNHIAAVERGTVSASVTREEYNEVCQEAKAK